MLLPRWPLLGSAFVFAVSAAACAGLFRGEPVPCEHDADCGNGFICEGALRRVCVAAIECTGDSQCPVGASCIERAVSAPDNPFEGDHVEKQVCDCLSDCGTGGFNAGGAPTGGQGGEPAGGAPIGGQGGEPAGGAPTGGQGGAGGRGGSGGAQQGGAGGQGGGQ